MKSGAHFETQRANRVADRAGANRLIQGAAKLNGAFDVDHAETGPERRGGLDDKTIDAIYERLTISVTGAKPESGSSERRLRSRRHISTKGRSN